MTELTEEQRELLAKAAADENGVDAPDDKRLIRSLVRAGLLIALPRQCQTSRLIITDAGREAIGAPASPAALPEIEATSSEAESSPHGAAPQERQAMPGGKLGVLVDLLGRPEGATMEAMAQATGWQKHSVRGALSGGLKKRLGLKISSDKTEAGRIYRIEQRADA